MSKRPWAAGVFALIALGIVGCGGGAPPAIEVSVTTPLSFSTTKATYSRDDLYRFFVVAFGAAPGVTFMGQTTAAADSGMSVRQIVNVFTDKPQFLDTYPASLSDLAFARKLTENVVGASATSTAKDEAVQDIVNGLSSGMTRGDVIYAMFSNLANMPSSDPKWGRTSVKLSNQIAHAKFFTESLGEETTDLSRLRAAVADVNELSPPPAPPSLSATNVLVDLSHEFTFTYDIFAQHAPYWDSKFKRTSNNANLASESVDLARYDIVVINQGETGVAFGKDEIDRLHAWVHDRGGRLVLVARGQENLPLAKLAARFNITFPSTIASKPYQIVAHPATLGVSDFVTSVGAPPGTVVSSSSQCDTLVTDSKQKSVVLACSWGAGRVVAISEPAFVANPYVQEIINVKFTKQLMSWLGTRMRAETTTIPRRIVPEIEKILTGGAKLLFTANTADAPFVSAVETQHAKIDQELQRITGLQNVYGDRMTFIALPCGGGGYSGGAEVGVCGFGDTGFMTMVFAHELMHSFDNPNAGPEMMHPVISYVATKVATALGGAAATAAAEEKRAWDIGFKSADPTGTMLDVTNESAFDRRGKMYWIMGRLEGAYPFATTNLYDFAPAARDPDSFLRRFYQRKRSDSNYLSTPTNTVRLLSIAACRDLFPDFRAIGTSLSATPAALAAEIDAECK